MIKKFSLEGDAMRIKNRRRIISLGLLLCLAIQTVPAHAAEDGARSGAITWVDFDIPSDLLKKAMAYDIDTYLDDSTPHVSWISMLVYLAARCGGDFSKLKKNAFESLTSDLAGGKTMAALTDELKHYGYYEKAYTAVLGGFLGEYERERETEDGWHWEQSYGLKAFCPIAKGFAFDHYDDFGNGRSYGYSRKHLGHDLMALTGTPIVAVESGVVEELGWNQYGGWRVGIRSFDGSRYYYYAHMRQNRPYAEGLSRGDVVMAGDVIGYVGRTGYSAKENTNGITQSHLHFGMQLIFDESQKDGQNQIWIDLFELTAFLTQNRSETLRNPETKEHHRAFGFREPIPDDRFIPPEQEADMAGTVSTVPLSTDGDGSPPINLPVLMYHSVLKDPDRHGPYVVAPWELEADLKYLAERGYTAVTTGDLIAFVDRGVPLPEKPVMLTFDDGHYNNLHYAEPLLEKYGMRAVMFVIGAYADQATAEADPNPNYAYVTWEDMGRMASSGLWDIQSHSWDLHQNGGGRLGVSQARGETEDAYRSTLYRDFIKITDRIAAAKGFPPTAFAYPFGQMTETADAVLLDLGYRLTFSCHEGMAEITPGDPSSLLRIKRFIRPSGRYASEILS
ncbi:polysaccharide deacetylase family protein [Oscillospiraceae bacterium OttesenSCG-928-F05]|nr:polysaccharide deacetylase family protein [Oscillospiraceae bacterium OttesenSCG-928-F05]